MFSAACMHWVTVQNHHYFSIDDRSLATALQYIPPQPSLGTSSYPPLHLSNHSFHCRIVVFPLLYFTSRPISKMKRYQVSFSLEFFRVCTRASSLASSAKPRTWCILFFWILGCTEQDIHTGDELFLDVHPLHFKDSVVEIDCQLIELPLADNSIGECCGLILYSILPILTESRYRYKDVSRRWREDTGWCYRNCQQRD